MASDNCLRNPETGSKFPAGGCLVSNEPSNLPKFGATRTVPSKDLPKGVDLRPCMTPVEHQENLNSCVGNALAGAYEFLIMKNSKKHIDVSRLFIYYNGRLEDGCQDYNMVDRGTYIRSAIAGLAKYGCCKENLFEYHAQYVNIRPPPMCYQEATNYRIASAMNVNVDLDEMKACLAEGYPFTFGLQLFGSFAVAENNGGRVLLPQPYESLAAKHGVHAMLAVGYSDPSACFIVRNSWGAKWGDKGYCYIPYEYMANSKYCSDLHAIKAVSDERHHHQHTHVPNPYDWNSHKDSGNLIPYDYPYKQFDHTFFWKMNDIYNYFAWVSQNGTMLPFQKKESQKDATFHEVEKESSEKTDSPVQFILWIDKKSDDNMYVANQLTSGKRVQIQFYETIAEAEKYLLANKEKIRSSSKPQIICRGYYKNENKNPLDLLEFLLIQRLTNISVFAFTQDKSGVYQYIQNQAPSKNINDWQKKITIVDSSNELIQRIKQNINKN